MNEKIDIKPKFLSPFKRFCMTIGELPTSYVETMTYYEMILWFTKYLGDTVIPTINNNSEALKEVQSLFIELQNYVNTYFDDLNIQTEIDNKLDAMAESGQLVEIISLYLNSQAIISFDTLSDMKSAENLINGSFAKTYGTSSYNDGIGYFYKIRELTEADTIDENELVSLHDNTLVGEKISSYVINDTKNPIYYGADPTGTTDSAQAINECIQANKGGTIDFSIGTYLVNSTINLPYKINEKVNINGNGATLKNTTNLTRLIYVGYDKGVQTPNDVGYVSYIKDLNIDGSESETQYCIDIINGYKDLKLFNLRIFRFVNGVRIGETTGNPADVLMTNSLLYGKGSENEGVGIISNCTDNNIEMCRIYGFRKGFVINGGLLISRCQVLLRWAEQTTANFDPYTRNGVEWNLYYPLTMFAEVNAMCRIIESYCDSTYKILDIKTSNEIVFTNSLYFNSRENVDMRLFDFNTIAYPQITIKNNILYCSHNTEGEVIHNTETFTIFSQIAIHDNILKRNLNLTNPADIILSSSTGKYIQSVTCTQNTWYIIGAIRNNSAFNLINMNLSIGGYSYHIHCGSDDNKNITDIYQYSKGEGNSRWSIGTVKVGDIIYLCVKNNNETGLAKFYINSTDSYSPIFITPIIKTGSNLQQSSHLLSDYTNLTPTNEVRLKNALF